VLGLLEWAAEPQCAIKAHPARALDWTSVDERQMRYVSDSGLMPLLYHATCDDPDQVPTRWRDALKGAELTARVRHANLVDAANEILDACAELGVRAMLLKGMSIGDQFYPVAHARLMGDIDILVDEPDCEPVEAAILRRGYLRKPNHKTAEGAHHGAPMFNPERHVWVEVHTRLFCQGAWPGDKKFFSTDQVADQTVSSSFHGRPIDRLSAEMQMVYIASSWIRDLSRNNVDPSFVFNLLDTVYLLKASGTSLDWDGVLRLTDSETAVTSLYVMLHYLSRHELVPSATEFLPRLAARQQIVGPPELWIIDRILDSQLIGIRTLPRGIKSWHAKGILGALLSPGRRPTQLLSLPWKLVFPPGLPDRYSARFHLDRIKRLMRRNQ
jgi:hypothetical protein